MIHMTSIARILRSAPWRLQLLHSVPYDRVFWVTHGQGRAVFAGRRWGVGAGNVIYLPESASLSLDVTANTTGKVLTFSNQLDGLWPSRPVLYRTRDMGTQAEFAGQLEAISREDDADRPHAEAAKAAHLQLMAIWLQRKLDAENVQTKAGASERLITAFLKLIETDYATGVPMAAFAEKLGVTPTHLSRACRDKLGRTAADLLTERTLFAARNALETTASPIKVIAQSVGFGSPAYFSRFILSHTGQTPSVLRGEALQR